MSKHPKPGGGNPHSNPHNDGTTSQKRSVTGDVHVRGEVLIEPTPKEALAREAEKTDKDAKQRKQWWLELATFGVLTVYAALTAVQSCQAIKSADAAKSAADTAAISLRIDQRAWVGLVKISLTDSSKPVSAGKPFYINVAFKNLGKTPAYNVVGHARATTVIGSNLWDHSVSGSRYGLLQPNGDVFTTKSFYQFGQLSACPIDTRSHGSIEIRKGGSLCIRMDDL